MVKSIIIKKFIKENKCILYPLLKIRGFVSIASPPYSIDKNLSSQELLDKIFDTLKFSKEIEKRPSDWKEFNKEYLKGIGIKTMKDLHNDSISLDVYVEDNIITFVPSENKGSKEGFVGFKDDLDVRLPFDSPKEELVKALELALSRCK